MKKLQIILLGLIVVGLGLLATQKYWVGPFANFIVNQSGEGVAVNDPLNLTYTLQVEPFTLVNGKWEQELAVDSASSPQAGSASKEVRGVFGYPVYGDVDQDGDEDGVMFLVQNTGGSGTFFYLVVAIRDKGVYKGTNAMFLGDRIAPQNINFQDGRAVANFAERKAGEPMTTPPSVGRSVWVHYDAKSGEIGEWVKDFEGESR